MTEPITLSFLGRTARITKVLPSHPTLFVETEGLTVIVEFDPPLNGTLSVYLRVLARRYTREEFIDVVRAALRGWNCVEEKLKHQREEREKAEAELKALATTLATDLGLEGPGN